jgi:hypothetical protein
MANGKDRDRRREARWRRIIREHNRSGLTIREFCRRGKLTETAFYFWRSELRRREVERCEGEQEQRRQPTHRARRQAAVAPAFVPVRIEEQVSCSGDGSIEIELPGGRRVHVGAPVDRQALTDVLAVLEGRPC